MLTGIPFLRNKPEKLTILSIFFPYMFNDP